MHDQVDKYKTLIDYLTDEAKSLNIKITKEISNDTITVDVIFERSKTLATEIKEMTVHHKLLELF